MLSSARESAANVEFQAAGSCLCTSEEISRYSDGVTPWGRGGGPVPSTPPSPPPSPTSSGDPGQGPPNVPQSGPERGAAGEPGVEPRHLPLLRRGAAASFARCGNEGRRALPPAPSRRPPPGRGRSQPARSPGFPLPSLSTDRAFSGEFAVNQPVAFVPPNVTLSSILTG